MRLCEICGEPLRVGRVHSACRGVPDKNSGRWTNKMKASLEILEREVKAGLPNSIPTKVWSKGMGEEKLKEMFPDKA